MSLIFEGGRVNILTICHTSPRDGGNKGNLASDTKYVVFLLLLKPCLIQ